MIWFIIKGLHPGICLQNSETHNMCHSWRAAMQIKSSEKYCISSSYVIQCFLMFVSGSLWMQNMLVIWSWRRRVLALWKSTVTYLQAGPPAAPSVPAPGRLWWSHWQWWHSWRFRQKCWLGWLQPEIKNRKVPMKMLTVNIPPNNWLNNREN